MAFKNNNVAAGLKSGDDFQVGKSDVDSGLVVENGVLLPWPSEPEASWVYYDCTVGVMLDSGIAVHNRLPQVNNTPDTLASCVLDDPNLDKIAGPGVNIRCRDQYTDIVQRMGHARYWFRLWGQALRVGLQIPIPSIKTIGGVPAIPYDRNPQSAFNRIAPGGNYMGAILWHAAWSLWYTTAVPPRTNDFPAADPFAHISNKAPLPAKEGIQAPFSQPDDDAVKSAPSVRPGPTGGTGVVVGGPTGGTGVIGGGGPK